MGILINRRRVMGGEVLPYDAEVEYLRGTGTQYIDTGIECTGDLSVSCKARFSTDVNMAMMGGIYNFGSRIFRHHFSPSRTAFYWLQNNNQGQASISLSVALNTWYSFDIDASRGQYVVNGVAGNFTPVEASVSAGANYGLFGRLSGNVAIQIRTGNNDIAFCQLLRNGVLLRDFIPVRVGQVGYMYDRVSGQLFGNAGTGEFVVGNDI